MINTASLFTSMTSLTTFLFTLSYIGVICNHFQYYSITFPFGNINDLHLSPFKCNIRVICSTFQYNSITFHFGKINNLVSIQPCFCWLYLYYHFGFGSINGLIISWELKLISGNIRFLIGCLYLQSSYI
jgi:hypothetical protein